MGVKKNPSLSHKLSRKLVERLQDRGASVILCKMESLILVDCCFSTLKIYQYFVIYRISDFFVLQFVRKKVTLKSTMKMARAAVSFKGKSRMFESKLIKSLQWRESFRDVCCDGWTLLLDIIIIA